MAKGVNLTNTNIREFYGYVKDDANGNPIQLELTTTVEVLDENGNLVRTDSVKELFTLISTQRRGNMNNYLRLSSQEYNNDKVNENKPTWIDL